MDSETPRVHVDDEIYPDAPLRLLEAAVRITLEDQGRPDVEVSVALLPDEEMRRLNREFLDKDRTTDVLAFTLGEDDGSTVGDVYLGYEQAQRQAKEVGASLREELARLVIHGTLHVLGFDHPDGAGRAKSPMFQLQEALVHRLMERTDTDG